MSQEDPKPSADTPWWVSNQAPLSNFENDKTRKGVSLLSAITMALVAGVTVAANINANGGLKLEFGQGFSGTSTCEQSLTVTPLQGFDNTTIPTNYSNPTINGQEISGIFTTDAVEFSGINDGCLGKDLIIKAYDVNGNQLILTDDSSTANITAIRISLATPSKVFSIGPTTSGNTVNATIDMIDTTTADTNSFDLIFDPGTATANNSLIADARNVYKFTIETAPHQNTQ